MPDHNPPRTALREEPRRSDRAAELALTPRVRLSGQLLYVSTTSARTRRRSHGSGAAPAGSRPGPARASVRV